MRRPSERRARLVRELLSDADARMYEEKHTRGVSIFPRVDLS